MSKGGPQESPFPPLGRGAGGADLRPPLPERAAAGSLDGRAHVSVGEAGSGGPDGSQKRTDVSDEALMMCVQDGDLTSLQELMLRHQRALYGFLARYTGDRHLAEDLFQDCFVRLVQKRSAFDPTRGFRPWLYAVAANLARDACRRREVRSREAGRERLALKREPPRPDEDAAKLEEAEIVREVIAELPGDARAMVLMHFFQGMTYRETAAALDVPIGTVKSRMHWAVQKLAAKWNERAASMLTSGSAGQRG